MDTDLKKTLESVTPALRDLLEGGCGSDGKWKPADLEQWLAAIGVRLGSVARSFLGTCPGPRRKRASDGRANARKAAGFATVFA